MNRINLLIKHPVFIKSYNLIDEIEKDRIYCKHTIQHALDVSRIAYIITLQDKKCIEKEIVYAIGLLHDIGRSIEDFDKDSHAKKSVELSKRILEDCMFSKSEIEVIQSAILHHQFIGTDYLESTIYKADKESRLCLFCNARNSCKWIEFNDYIFE